MRMRMRKRKRKKEKEKENEKEQTANSKQQTANSKQQTAKRQGEKKLDSTRPARGNRIQRLNHTVDTGQVVRKPHVRPSPFPLQDLQLVKAPRDVPQQRVRFLRVRTPGRLPELVHVDLAVPDRIPRRDLVALGHRPIREPRHAEEPRGGDWYDG